jgi:hypothetical protein
VPIPWSQNLIALLFVGCISGSVLHLDVVGAPAEKEQELKQAAFEFSNALSKKPRSPLSVIVLSFHSIFWRGVSSGVIVFFSAYMPDDDVGLQIGEGRNSSIALRSDLKGQELREVFIHEIGHVLGVAHSPNEAAIMYKYSTADNLNEPSLAELKKSIPLCK